MSLAYNDGEGNHVQELPAEKYTDALKALRMDKNDALGGLTESKKYITNNSTEATDNTRAHEIGHTLGEDDGDYQIGVMAYEKELKLMSNVTVKNGEAILKRDIKEIKKSVLDSSYNGRGGIRNINVQGIYQGKGSFKNIEKITLGKDELK